MQVDNNIIIISLKRSFDRYLSFDVKNCTRQKPPGASFSQKECKEYLIDTELLRHASISQRAQVEEITLPCKNSYQKKTLPFSANKIILSLHAGSKVRKRTRSSPFFRSIGVSFQRRMFGQTSHNGSRLPHDLGGSPDFLGSFPIDTSDSELQVWEKECHALFPVLASKSYSKNDQLRWTTEDLTPSQYSDFSYYGKWSAAMATPLMDGGFLSDDELRVALLGKR